MEEKIHGQCQVDTGQLPGLCGITLCLVAGISRPALGLPSYPCSMRVPTGH